MVCGDRLRSDFRYGRSPDTPVGEPSFTRCSYEQMSPTYVQILAELCRDRQAVVE